MTLCSADRRWLDCSGGYRAAADRWKLEVGLGAVGRLLERIAWVLGCRLAQGATAMTIIPSNSAPEPTVCGDSFMMP